MIQVLIVDDHAIIRQGLKRILDMEKDIEVAGEAVNGVDALNKIHKDKYDIVLLDISMPEKNGIDTLKKILVENKKAKVLMLSMYSEDQYAVRLMKAGASGYMTKDVAPEQLVEAIHNVLAGKKHISPTLAELLLSECVLEPGKVLHETLSNREYQVLRLIGSGKGITEIAEILSLNVKTVSSYRTLILEKMGMKNNAELTHYVIQNSLIDL